MRLTSLIVLLAIVGGIGYVLVFKRDWIFSKAKEGLERAQGYTEAKTPREAQDFFLKAIKDRQFDTAAKYLTGDYAENLAKAHDAGRSIGKLVDTITNYMNNKGLKTDSLATALWMFDPFPTNFKVKDNPKETGGKTYGFFEMEFISGVGKSVPSPKRLDPLMFKHNLAPLDISKVEIVSSGAGDEKTWKLSFPMVPGQVQSMAYFRDNYKTYETGLERFWKNANNDRYASKREFENEVLQVFDDARPKQN